MIHFMFLLDHCMEFMFLYVHFFIMSSVEFIVDFLGRGAHLIPINVLYENVFNVHAVTAFDLEWY